MNVLCGYNIMILFATMGIWGIMNHIQNANENTNIIEWGIVSHIQNVSKNTNFFGNHRTLAKHIWTSIK